MAKKIMVTTGDIFKKYREENKLSLKGFADILETSYQYYNKIERNEKAPSRKTLDILYENYSVSELDKRDIKFYEDFRKSGPLTKNQLIESLIRINELEKKLKEDNIGSRIYKAIKDLEKEYFN